MTLYVVSGSEQSSARACKKIAAGREPAAHVVAVALSAGGLVVVRQLLAELPENIPAAVVVAQHMHGVTYLPSILKSSTRLDVKLAEAGEPLRCGTVYVGPPDRHVIVTADASLQLAERPQLRLTPSADWLFESLAGSFGDRTVAVVLSGRLSDGARGVVHVKRSGGYVIAQEPGTCMFPDMPMAAIRSGAVDASLPPHEMAPAIMRVLQTIDVARGEHQWRAPFAAKRTH